MQNHAVPITVDTAAAIVRPGDVDLQTWMAGQRVFISSVMSGMTKTRCSVADAIEAAGAIPVYFEAFGGRDDDAEVAYLDEVASSTIYLGILGAQYGRLLKSRLSATHEEFRAAENKGLSISAWIQQNSDYNTDQAALIEEIRLFHTTGSYTAATDLCASVTRRLSDMAAADISPWIKLGDLVFRARSVGDDGRTLTVAATLRDPLVISGVEQLRPGSWGGKQERRLTYNGQSLAVRVMSVETTASTRSAAKIIVTLERTAETDVSWPMTVSVSGHTYDFREASLLHVRSSLFGDAIPRTLLTWGGRVDDPFKDFPANLRSDELQRALLRLLITEALVRSGRASRVLKLDISPDGPSGRRAALIWAGPTSRSGTAEPLETSGTLLPLPGTGTTQTPT